MSRYIDAYALVKRLEHSPLFLGTHMQFKDGVIDLVERQPTADVVAVVRCKDCKRCKVFKRVDGTYFFSCRCGCFREVVSADHYCAYGERREENER